MRLLRILTVIAFTLLGLTAAIKPDAFTQVDAQTGPAFDFVQVASDVYCVIGTGRMNVGANSVVIVNERDVLLVDSTTSPAAALRLKEELKKVTDKPIRYVVNTHFHFDHTFGNQVFESDAVIIGHQSVREQLAPGPPTGRTYETFVTGLDRQIEQLKIQADQETDAAKKNELLVKLQSQQKYRAEISEVRVVPPNLTFPDRIKLTLGNREIQLIHYGPAHTAGDVVVFLPKERIVCTGDLYNGYMGYLADAFVNQWADALGDLAKLDFETVIPGHGKPLKGKDRIPIVQACLKDLWEQAKALKARGLSVEDAAKQVDLTKHKADLPQFSQPGISQLAMQRIFELLEEGK